MKRKRFGFIFGVTFVLFICTAIAGCHHPHEWELTSSSGSVYHWYECRECQAQKDYSLHEYEDGVCFCGQWQLNYRWNDNNEACVISPNGFFNPNTKVVIPSEYQGTLVTTIGQEAFRGCSNMVDVEIPNSVTRIEERAFWDCEGLTSVVVPKSVTKISGNAFLNCKNLTSIEVDSENPIYKSENNCILILDGQTLVVGSKTDVIPNGVTRIGDNAFEQCTDLQNFEIPNRVTSIGKGAFRDCSGLNNLVIPESVTNIGKDAFRGCSGLSSIEVGEGNPNYLSENDCLLTKDGETLLLGCKNSVIPNGITRIGDGAFSGCLYLETIEIPSSVTSVGDEAFADCRQLRWLQMPDPMNIRITNVGKGIFSGCLQLYEFRIPFGVTEIPDETFFGCRSLDFVEIPDSVTAIGSLAFAGCEQLRKVEIPNSVTEIGESAFHGCQGLQYVEMQNGVAKIGNSAFENCPWLRSIEIPDSVTEIGERTFYDCGGLMNVVLSENLTRIGKFAFQGCIRLTAVTIPDGVTKIEEGAFYISCDSIELPVSVTEIGKFGLGFILRIDYKGTMAQWEEIKKAEYWNPWSNRCTVYCTDGEIDGSLRYAS